MEEVVRTKLQKCVELGKINEKNPLSPCHERTAWSR